MRTALAHNIADHIDGWLATKQATKAEAELQRRLSGLFDEALDAAIIQLRDRGVFGATDIPIIDGFLSGLTPDMATEVTFVNSQFTDPKNRFAAEHLRDLAFTASERTMSRARARVGRNLEKSFREGLGIQEAARNLRRTFRGLKDHELRRIARTETHNAQIAERNQAHVRSGVIHAHEWIPASDVRVRHSHNALRGEIVRVGSSFSNGLKFPGDTSGPLEEWINCRCRLAPFFPRRGFMLPAGNGPWKSSDMLLIKDELDLGGLERNYDVPDELLFDLYSRRPIPTDAQSLRVLRQQFPERAWRTSDIIDFRDNPPPVGGPLVQPEAVGLTPARISRQAVTETTMLGNFHTQRRLDVQSANEVLYWEGEKTNAVQKPIAGEADFILEDLGVEGNETLASRERSAYLLDQALGFDNVPVTVVRELDGENSMVQQWIDGAKQGHDGLDQDVVFKIFEGAQAEELQVLDYLMFNFDRHGGNFLVKDAVLHAIDNGYSFPATGQPYFGNAFTETFAPYLDLETYREIMADGPSQSVIDAVEDLDLGFMVSEFKKAGIGPAAIELFEQRHRQLIVNMDDPDWFFNNVILLNIDAAGQERGLDDLLEREESYNRKREN